MTALTRWVRSLPPRDIGIASSATTLPNGLRLSLGLSPPMEEVEERAVSRSRAGLHHARLIAASGRVGVDIETLDRVAANATEHDDWLSAAERAAVRSASSAVLELACHWVLKEAYGKAIGVGLGLPLHALSFVGGTTGILLDGAPSEAGGGWYFALYRRGTLVIGIAYRAEPQARTPFAPFGRNPPMVVVDR